MNLEAPKKKDFRVAVGSIEATTRGLKSALAVFPAELALTETMAALTELVTLTNVETLSATSGLNRMIREQVPFKMSVEDRGIALRITNDIRKKVREAEVKIT